MKINWKIRFKNPIFIVQCVLSLITPILGYMGINYQDLTTWGAVGNMLLTAITNPYVLGLACVSLYGTITDPTTKGFSDSSRALSYTGFDSQDIKEDIVLMEEGRK